MPKSPQCLFCLLSSPGSLCSLRDPFLIVYLPPVANGSSKFFLKLVQELGSQLSFEGNEARHYRETDPRPAKERGYEVRKGDMTVE